MLHVQIIMYIALYSVSVSNCRIRRWIQPPEQRKTAEFSAAVTKKSSFLYKKMCTVSYNVQEQHFAVHIVYYHMLMKILVVGTQNSTKCEN